MTEVRPIDANALEKAIMDCYCKDCNSYNGVRCRACNFDDAISVISDAQTLDYVPVGRGQWEDGAFENSKRCTKCGRYSSKIFTYREGIFDYLFCPYCGAKMDGGTDR